MCSSGKLKRLILDIVSLVVVFSLIGSIFLIQQQGYRTETFSNDSGLIDEDQWYAVKNQNAGVISNNAPKCLIVFDANDEESVLIKENIEYVLHSINVFTNTHEVCIPTDDEIDDDPLIEDNTAVAINTVTEEYDYKAYDEIIFCISNLMYAGVDVDAFTEWVSTGGHVLFAAGLESNEAIIEWLPVLGIKDSTMPLTTIADSMKFNTSILAGTEGREFSDDVINCEVLDVSLLSDCLSHITTCDDEVPLLWERSLENGTIIVCNADLFDSKADRGIIAATYCQFYSAFVYPVINAAVYCIDDCPAPTPAGYDNNVLSQYGYTVSDFIANVWMPAMEQLHEKYDIRFTTFTIQSYSDDVNGPFDNQDNIKSAKYYASLILNMDGEIGIHGYNHQPLVLEGFVFDEENSGYTAWPSVKKMTESIHAVIQYTESLANDLYVQAYIAPSNVISEEALNALQNHFEDLRIYAGVYIGTPDQMVQEFKVLDNGTVYCPRLTADMQMEDSEWWLQINELNYHYVASNFIHPDDILDEERNDGGDFKQMLSGYSEMIEWNQRYGLKTATISECGASVQRFSNLSYSQTISGNNMSIKLDGLIDTAYMMLRLNGKRPVSIEGGTYSKIGDNIYILEINSENVSIKLVDQS